VGEGRELSRNGSRTAQSVHAELLAMSSRQATLEARFEQVAAQLASLVQAEHRRSEIELAFRADVIAGMRWIHADESWHRRRLRELRATAEYERAYTDPDPLISVLIPTYDRLDLLRSRAIPSILGQEYRNLEIVVVGDNAPYGLAEITEGFHGAPIRFFNLPLRGPYPEDARRRWMVSGATPFNEAMAAARGIWLAPFADDDEMRPNHLRALLEAARERRLEFVYGRLQMRLAEHGNPVLGLFPPQFENIGLQAALLHGQLRLFELELADAEFEVPADWGLIQRMLRAGVRTGMIDEIVADYYPSMRGTRAD
jgi:Glycosyl transferase family 2